MQSFAVTEYQIGIICALPKELKAVNAILDERHEPLKSKDGADHNSYVLGRIGKHNVVAAGLPAGVYGTTSAASVAKDMIRTFHQLRFGLLVGIAGGIPDIQAKRDIRLGDVVVSQPDGAHGGVVQYDLGKLLNDGQFVLKGNLNKPPQTLLTALTNLQADLHNDRLITHYLEEIDRKYPGLESEGYSYQGTQQDQLHCVQCDPSRWWWILWLLIEWLWPLWRCDRCEKGKVIRPLRRWTTPVIHYGTIASGNTLLKNATKRDQLARELGALCVEMEAAGLDDYPCLVIRGICDYSDTYKNDIWQEYAALTAAAFTKMLLEYVSPEAAREERLIQTVLDQLDRNFQFQHEHNTRIDNHHKRQETHYHDDKHQACHRVFDISNYEAQKNINMHAVPGTCRWVLDHPRYYEWLTSTKDDLLWISADPGCGKSVLSRSLVDNWLTSTRPHAQAQTSVGPYTICYFFFKDNEDQSSLSTALCAILHQLFSHQPELIRHALPVCSKHKEERLTRNVDELWRILRSATTDRSMQPIICVLDALDECRDADRQQLVTLLCQFHEASTSNSNGQSCLKWLVTSRPHDDIQGYFGQLPTHLRSIRLRGEDEDDQIREEINLVIDQRMRELGRQLGLTNKKREEVTQQLREMDNRTYLWLHLVLEDIEVKFKKSPRPNQEKIVALPATVYQAYDNILKRVVDIEEKQYAKMILTIIVGALRPLSIDEMALAFDIATLSEVPNSLADLTIDASILGDKIRGWCGLFVFVKHNRLYLIHQTAKEFLQSHHNETIPSSDSWKHCLRPLDVDKEMAKICVIFLCLSELDILSSDEGEPQSSNNSLDPFSMVCSIGDDDDDDGSGLQNFFDFASEHWAYYVRRVEAELDLQVSLKIKTLYHSRRERHRRQIMIRWHRTPTIENAEPDMDEVCWASHNGHCLALRHFLRTNPDRVNQGTVEGDSPLFWATRNGHQEVAEILLAQPGVDVNLGNPLALAVENEHYEIAKIILAQPDTDVNLGEPLYWAASNGHQEFVKILLARPGIDINLGEPLSWVAMNGDQDMVKILLTQSGVDVNHGRPLSMAATNGHQEIVRMLLAQPGIDVNLGTPLGGAVRNGHQEVVKILLAQLCVDVNFGEPLFEAVLRGHQDIVELLLAQPGIDINLGELLACAARHGHQEIVELLLAQPGINTIS